MRYLRKQVINRRAPWDQRLQVDINNSVLMSTPAALQLPAGSTLERPIVGNLYGVNAPTDIRGMVRYNTETNQLEGYQAGVWRSFRFKESTGITQQNLGAGDSDTIYFGPLNPAPPTLVESGKSWGGQNLLVVVENVIQLHNTNYTIVQNPTIAGVTYTPNLDANAVAGATTILFDTITDPIYPAVSIVGATVTGSARLLAGTTVVSYTTVPETGELASIVISQPVTGGDIVAGTMLTITDSTNTGSGYYVKFDSPVPYGKSVTVLHGFDQ
jgi:hypothetical protein